MCVISLIAILSLSKLVLSDHPAWEWVTNAPDHMDDGYMTNAPNTRSYVCDELPDITTERTVDYSNEDTQCGQRRKKWPKSHKSKMITKMRSS